MTVVAYGVDHGVDGLLNVVKGYGKPPTPPSYCQNKPGRGHRMLFQGYYRLKDY